MQASLANGPATAPARILFVDDEQRVTTAMRAMFRREYDVEIANSGAEALERLEQGAFDVIVSDQRMPGMTGVELLREARERAPATMRVLLTGYADLAAIEHAINEAEVFRYLMKPCPREALREVLALAVDASATLAVDAPPVSAVPAGDDRVAAARVVTTSPAPADAAIGFLVLSRDPGLADGVRSAVGDRHEVHTAADLDAAIRTLGEIPIGVVVTDLAVDEGAVTELTTSLKRAAPELVTIVASDRSDAHLMIDLINHGQVFRFLLKPLSPGQCRIWLASAVNRHLELVAHPDATARYTPAATEGEETSIVSRMLTGLRGLRGRLRGAAGVRGAGA